MAVVLVSDYEIGDASLNDLMTSTDDQRYGFRQSSLTEWNTTTKPEIAGGTRFEDNGALYKVTTDTAISGSPTGKTYIVFDASALTFSFSNTAPTWADDKQGWYGTGGAENDRYLPFIMTVSGASYSDKRITLVNNESDRVTLEDGADADKELFFASDASVLWDESEDEFVIDKKLNLTGDVDLGSDSSDDINLNGTIQSIGTIQDDLLVGSYSITSEKNININTGGSPATEDGVLKMTNGSEPSVGDLNSILLYSVDISGDSSLGLRTENSNIINASGDISSTHTLAIRINGTTYYLMMSSSGT